VSSAALAQATDPTSEPEVRPRSPSLLELADHPGVAERTRAVAAELARILVTRTMLEMGVLAANDNEAKKAG